MGKPRNVEDSDTLKLPYGRVFVIAGPKFKDSSTFTNEAEAI